MTDTQLFDLADELGILSYTEFNFGVLAHRGHRIGTGKARKVFKGVDRNEKAAAHLRFLAGV
jgi:hypothetical protein